jgi:zinc transporter
MSTAAASPQANLAGHFAPDLFRDDGLICGYRFAPGQGGQELPSARHGLELLPGLEGSFVWLHFNLSHAGAQRWLRENLPPGMRFLEEIDGGSRSARIDRDGEALLAVLNDVTYDFQYEAREVETLWMSVGARLVVSARLRPLRAVDQLRGDVRRGAVVDNSIDLLDRLLQTQADELQAIVRKAGERLDDIEDAVLAGSHRPHARELARLRRLMVRLQRLLTPEPAALARVISRPPAWMGPADLPHLVQANEEFTLVLRDIAALQERVRLVQDECATRLNEENGRSLFTLTMVTVLALPINLVSGLFGMNVGGIPLAEHPAGFWLMVTFIATVTLLIARQVWRRMRAQEG